MEMRIKNNLFAKRIITILFFVFAILTVCFFLNKPTFATEIIDQGTCGDKLTWTLDDEGTLIISGKGEIYDIGIFDSAPWSIHENDIKSLIIKKGGNKNWRFSFLWVFQAF